MEFDNDVQENGHSCVRSRQRASLSLAACGSDDTDSGSSASGSAAAAKRACVMLPDADSSSRWENGDRPALEKSFKEIGFETDIQNALNDTGKYATLADQQLTKGCSVMLLVDLNGAGAQVMDKAHAQGIPVIAYDRPIKGADYYVSFDNFHVGELEGQMIVDGLKAEGKDAKTRQGHLHGWRPDRRQRQAVPRRRGQHHERGRDQARRRAAGRLGRRRRPA